MIEKDTSKISDQLRVYIVDIVPPTFPAEQIETRLIELESLVTTYKWVVIVKTLQKRTQPDYRTYVWKGKLEEIREDMIANDAHLLIIWNIMKPWQVYNVSELFRKDNIQVWDRVDLILKIFERHAQSTEARLQIELAAIHHMWPRIFGMGMELSRQWWWTWWAGWRAGRWIGETNTERMRRHLKDKTLVIKKELEKYQKTRWLHRAWRARKDLFTVGIVGYTNAGKSALMHNLTGKDILIENKLFATLGTSVGEMKPPHLDDEKYWQTTTDNVFAHTPYVHQKILVNDTIWFIRELPPELIEAFRSTLEDSIYSQLLLHVVDASDPHFSEKIDIVDEILKSIHADQPKLYVFNKIDAISEEQKTAIQENYAHLNPFFVSAITSEGVEDLKKIILKHLV